MTIIDELAAADANQVWWFKPKLSDFLYPKVKIFA